MSDKTVVKANQVWEDSDGQQVKVLSVTKFTEKEQARRFHSHAMQSSPKKVTFCLVEDAAKRCIPVDTKGCFEFEEAFKQVE